MASWMRNRQLIVDLAVNLLIIAYSFILSGVLITNSGLPSYSKGVFRDATFAFQIAEAKMIDKFGNLYIPSWYGFHDIVRFYPPLGLALMFTIGKIVGSFEYSGLLCFYISILLLIRGFFSFLSALVENKYLALLGAVLLPLVHGYFSTIAMYWEYTRILGEALVFFGLAEFYKLLTIGDEKRAVKAGFIGGLVLLTHLIAFVEYLVVAASMFAILTFEHWRRKLSSEGFSYYLRLVKIFTYSLLATSIWWLIPAVVPFGLKHYFLINPPLSFKVNVLAETVKTYPSLYTPALQAPIVFLGLASLAYLVYRRNYMLASATSILFILYFIYGQGTRILPFIGSMLIAATVLAWNTTLKNSGNKKYPLAIAVAVVAILLIYLPKYAILYSYYLEPDSTYVYSDEYKTALWLWDKVGEKYRVYLMYGEKYRGSQWVNVFKPKLRQVLGGYNEGCLNRTFLEYDYVIKNTLNSFLAEKLTYDLNVKYIVVDKQWIMKNKNNTVIDFLLEKGFVKSVDEINSILQYSEIYEVVNVEPIGNEKYDNIVFFTPTRIVAILLSFLIAVKTLNTVGVRAEKAE